MLTKSFLDSPEYQEFKLILADTIQNKPVNLKTEGKTNEMIAREVTAWEIAAKLVDKAIKKFERQVQNPVQEPKSWR